MANLPTPGQGSSVLPELSGIACRRPDKAANLPTPGQGSSVLPELSGIALTDWRRKLYVVNQHPPNQHELKPFN